MSPTDPAASATALDATAATEAAPPAVSDAPVVHAGDSIPLPVLDGGGDGVERGSEGLDGDASGGFAGEAATGLTPPAVGRKRPKPGERRVQILHTLAGMLEQPGAERVTTAALAARLDVSEAALYRHFASKAQMFEGLIEFIEQSVFTLVNQIGEREVDARVRAQKILAVVLQFGEKNPGMTRVMVGDALVFENERLVARMNQFFDRIESTLRQSLRAAAEAAASATPTVDANAQASVLTAFLVGRLQRYARSGFRRTPTEHLDAALRLLVRAEP